MKTIDLTHNNPTLAELMTIADEDTVLLTSPDGREYLFGEIDDFAREVERVVNNPELMAFLDERSRETKSLPLADVKKKLGIT